MAVKFIEPGGDADFGIGLWGSSDGSPAPTASNTIVHGSHQRSILYDNTNGNTSDVRATGVATDAGGRSSVYYYLSTLPVSLDSIMILNQSSNTNGIVSLRMTSGGILQLFITGGSQIGSNGATISTGSWNRICLCWTITSSTVNEFRVYVNGSLSITGSNVTLSTTGSADVRIGNCSGDTSVVEYTSDHYIDDSNTLTDTGDIWVTAKRPFSNGITNGFTTQIGSGGSGYGSGHAPQVNERTLNTANGWSMVGAGSAITEEYSIEGSSAGDIDISKANIVDFMGWVDAKALLSETASIIVAGATSNIGLTSTISIFEKIAGSATYPGGGTDIGIITSTTVTTVSLYEAGVVVAYIPATTITINVSDTTTTSENIGIAEIDKPSVSDTTVTSESLSYYSDSVDTNERLVLLETSFINVSDTTNTVENIVLSPVGFIAASDTTVTSESVVVNDVDIEIISDTSIMSENIGLLITNFISVPDAIVINESVNLNTIGFENVSDTSVTNDSVVVLIPILSTVVSDTIITSEVIIFSNLRISDTVAATESTTLLLVSFATVFDSVNYQENVQLHVSQIIVNDFNPSNENLFIIVTSDLHTSDSIAVSESQSVLIAFGASVSDAAATSELILQTMVYDIQYTNFNGQGQIVNTLENIGLLLSISSSLSDTVVTSESFQTPITSPDIASDTVTYSENVQVYSELPIMVTDITVTIENEITQYSTYPILVNDATTTAEGQTVNEAIAGDQVVVNDGTTVGEALPHYSDQIDTMEFIAVVISQQTSTNDTVNTNEDIVVSETTPSPTIRVSDAVSTSDINIVVRNNSLDISLVADYLLDQNNNQILDQNNQPILGNDGGAAFVGLSENMLILASTKNVAASDTVQTSETAKLVTGTYFIDVQFLNLTVAPLFLTITNNEVVNVSLSTSIPIFLTMSVPAPVVLTLTKT